MHNRTLRKNILMNLLMCIIVVIAIFPFLWMLFTSLKEKGATMTIPPTILPPKISWEGYKQVLDTNFLSYFFNSFYIAAVTTVGALILGVMAGIGFSRYQFKGSKGFKIGILVTQLFPLILLVPPYYLLMSKIGLLDSHVSLMITYCALTLPFCVWMLTTYFSTVPIDMEESAMIDGCSKLGAYIRITIPMAAPGIAATAIFAFVLAWNEFVFANTFIDTPGLRTLPIGLRTFMGQYSTQWNVLMAASVMTTLPVVLMFIFLQKYFIRGMTSGSVKG
ncbi:carbohydrate ABC transporter permease [Paenibacillus nasutitermitis]|uniref:Sugar ABC transporter permease n=1 Tax=Paenibacillus nasutitermitis TaxID=1652958 RepID=A0A916Z6R8_9BACL|nr:carbohydrate ABC transporter permease [Paenibacillus nasutitermitis]GGD77907.1 sugar ABC transporter permease [Paenibacillus nasutitermitis]